MLSRTSISVVALLIVTTPANAQYEWIPYENNPVIPSNFDATSTYTFRPSVVKRNGLYHMWYGKQAGLPQGSPRSVGYAVSEDGVEWGIEELFALEPSNILGSFDQIYATSPTVVGDGDTLRMWYSGAGNLADGIGYAWSTDGAEWTKVQGDRSGGSVFDRAMDPVAVDGVVSPSVVKKDGTYHLWYQKLVSSDGRSRIGYALSSDGVNWTVVEGPGSMQSVVDVGGPNTFDEDQVWWPWVLYNEEGGLFEMWYQGIDSPGFGGVPRLGCARSSDGVNWEKVAGTGAAGACSNSLAQPGVILDNDVYKMWYSLTTNASPQNDEIGYAVSHPTPTAVRPEVPPNTAIDLELYPNPFASLVRVRFELTEPAELTLQVLDLLGRTVYEKTLKHMSAGVQSFEWNGMLATGSEAPSGSYVIGIQDEAGSVLGFRVVQLLR